VGYSDRDNRVRTDKESVMRQQIHRQYRDRGKMSGATSKLRMALLLAGAVVMLRGMSAQADIMDVSIVGDVSFDTGFAWAANTTKFEGDISTIVGGVSAGSLFTGVGGPGINPLSTGVSGLTAIGDGFGMTADAEGAFDAAGLSEFAIGMDLLVDVTNTSATDEYEVTFRLDFSNFVDSSDPGDDAFVDAEFTLDDDFTGEISFTALVSDSTAVGGPMSDGGPEFFVINLTPGATWQYVGDLTMEGGAFDLGSHFESRFSAEFTVTDVKNLTVVPVPGAMLLGSMGLCFTGCLMRRRRKYRS
jgi:hypothetical protein